MADIKGFFRGIADGTADYTDKLISNEMAEVRARRLAEIQLETDGRKYTAAQERELAALTDPNSSFNKKRALAASDAEREAERSIATYRKKKELDKEFDKGTSDIKIEDYYTGEVDELTGEQVKKSIVFVNGKAIPADQVESVLAGASNPASDPAAPAGEPFDPSSLYAAAVGTSITREQIDASLKKGRDPQKMLEIIKSQSRSTAETPADEPTSTEAAPSKPAASEAYGQAMEMLSESPSWIERTFTSHSGALEANAKQQVENADRLLSNWSRVAPGLSEQEKVELLTRVREISQKSGNQKLLQKLNSVIGK